MKEVAIAGGSGLIGGFLLDLLLSESSISKIYFVGRSKPKSNSTKIVFIPLSELSTKNEMNDVQLDAAFCCLGTTIKNAGSKEKFEAVDLGLVVEFAKASKSAQKFLVVSSLGANSKSSVFYNAVKGRMEERVQSMGFKSSLIFRPSILTGPRKEFRLGEKIGIVVMSIFSPLMLGPMKKFRPIAAENVAKAMLNGWKSDVKGPVIIEGDEILRLAKK